MLHDTLTGLRNRVLFEQRLEYGLIQAKRRDWKLAVLFIDIDKFKSINDSYGHDLGDKVLLAGKPFTVFRPRRRHGLSLGRRRVYVSVIGRQARSQHNSPCREDG
jgi:predicted signal transduction protein with EAL and GGDEF domain